MYVFAGFGFLILNLATQNPARLGLVKVFENSTIFILLISALGFVIYWMKDFDFSKGTFQSKILNAVWFLFPILVFLFFINKVMGQYEAIGGLYRPYFLSLLFGETLIWLTVVIFMICFVLYLKKRLSRNFVLFLVIGVSILDLLVFNMKIGYLEKQDIFEKDMFPYYDIHSDLKDRMDFKNYRVGKVHHANLDLNDNLIFGIPSYVGGSSYLNKQFFDFIDSFDEKGPRAFLLSERDSFDDGRFLDLSAVRYNFIDANRLQTRKTMLSRLGLFYSYEVIEDQDKFLERLKEKSFPYKDKILLLEMPKIIFPVQNRESRTINILKSTSDYVYAQVNSNRSGLILFVDSYHRGWKAYVDGKPTDVYRANYNFMSCYLPAGEHKVEFRFEPQEFFNSLKISIFGIFIFIVITVILFSKRFETSKNENHKTV